MTGWKTWAAGIGGILSGAALIILSFTGDGSGSVTEGIALVVGGLAALGIGHKIEKSAK